VRLGAGELPVLDILAVGLLGLALLLAVVVDERVGQDPVQPGLEIRTLRELVEGGEGLDVGLLDEVLGVGGVARHAHRGGIELVEEGQCVPFEPGSPLLDRLFWHAAPIHAADVTTPRAYRARGQRPDVTQDRRTRVRCHHVLGLLIRDAQVGNRPVRLDIPATVVAWQKRVRPAHPPRHC
jgi:hypothetical protein